MERENVHGWTGSRGPEGETTTNTEERRRSIETTNSACFCVVVLCVPFVRSPIMHTLCDSPYACLDDCLSQHPTGRRRHCWYVSFCFCCFGCVEIGRAREKGKSPTPTSPCLVGLYPPKYQRVTNTTHGVVASADHSFSCLLLFVLSRCGRRGTKPRAASVTRGPQGGGVLEYTHDEGG